MPRRWTRGATLLAAAVALAVLPLSGVGAQDLDEVRGERAALEDDLQRTTRELEELEDELNRRADELEQLDATATEIERQLVAANAALEVRARSAFKRGGMSTLDALMSGGGPTEAVEKAATLDALARHDEASIEQASSLRIQLEQTRILREAALADLEVLERTMDERIVALNESLEEAKDLEAYLELKAKRQVRIDRGPQQGIYSCPMGRPYSFIDSWGFARSGGRSHKGVDIMAPFDTPVYAITAGRVSRMKTGGLGGIVLYLWGDDGNEYYYAHLAGYAPGVGVGTRVEAGDLLAYNGDSGNARGGAPHVHFEVHPGGGAPVNPYPWVAAPCYG